MRNGLKNADKVYGKVASTMKMEKFSLSESDAGRIKSCVSGEKSFNTTKQELIRKHKKAKI